MKDDILSGENHIFDYTETMPDRFNPFNNRTENRSARNDYRKIVPQISARGCVIPIKPSEYERKNIKVVYSKTGLTLVIHLIISNVIAAVISFIVSLIGISIAKDQSSFSNLYSNSSISISIVAITYTIANVCAFLIGCKLLDIPIRNVFNRPDVRTNSIAKHIIVAWCLQGICLIVVNIVYSIVYFFGVDLIPESALDSSNYSSFTYTIATFLYTCIIAPITEEMIFRGVVLKGFSVVSQRFGILMSALLFGLLHGNVLQFITTFTLGIYLGYVATKYNSILPTIVMHFFINLAPILIEIAFYSNDILSNYIMYGFYGIVVIVGIIIICVGSKNKSNRFPLQNAYQKTRTLPLAISSLGVLTVIVLYVIIMLMNHLL